MPLERRAAIAAPQRLGGAAALALVAACSPKDSRVGQHAAACDPDRGTAEERAALHRRALATTPLDTTGGVDFDHDQSTVVLAPFSGPVMKLLVTPGQVSKGQAARHGGFARLRHRRRRLPQGGGRRRAARKLAAMDQDLFAHQRVSQREDDQAHPTPPARTPIATPRCRLCRR